MLPFCWSWEAHGLLTMTDLAVHECTANALDAKKKSKDPKPFDKGADLYDEEEWFIESRNSFLCRTQTSFGNKINYTPSALDEQKNAARL